MTRMFRHWSSSEAHGYRLLRIGFYVAVFTAGVLEFSTSTAGIIELTDEAYNGDYCGNIDVPGLKTIYVQHYAVTGFTGCRFRIETGPGATLTYVSEVQHLPGTTGDTQSGMTVCYNDCNAGPRILLATITYMQYGTSEGCSKLLVVPHPDAETVEEMDCNYVPLGAYVQDFLLTCNCEPIHGIPGTPRVFGCVPLPVEQTTWGGIKALYR